MNRNKTVSVPASPVDEFYNPQKKKICLLDDNFLACGEWNALLGHLRETGRPVQFRQGLDIRLITRKKARELASCRLHGNQKGKGSLCFPNQTTIIGGYMYLLKTRCLSKEVVDWFVKKKLIYETHKYHNVVFIGRDSFGTARFASMRGTVDNYGNPFKGDVENNDKTYGFNVRNKKNKEVKVFEAAIDLMEKSKTLGALNLVMEGLPGESITMTFKEHDRYCPMVSIEELFLRSQYEMLPVRILASEILQEFQTAETGGIRLKMDTVKKPLFV